MNYSELLQLAKGWGNFKFYRIIIWRLLMKQRAEREGITETLKTDNQMEWVQRMNALRLAVTETVNAEVIFV